MEIMIHNPSSESYEKKEIYVWKGNAWVKAEVYANQNGTWLKIQS